MNIIIYLLNLQKKLQATIDSTVIHCYLKMLSYEKKI
jgi:hypothetical protein